jgi:hypothetical protein
VKYNAIVVFAVLLAVLPSLAASQSVGQFPFAEELSEAESARAGCWRNLEEDEAFAIEQCIDPFVEACAGSEVNEIESLTLRNCYLKEWEAWTGLREVLSAQLPSDWREKLRAEGTDAGSIGFTMQTLDDDEQLQDLTEICRSSAPTQSDYEQCAYGTALSATYRMVLYLAIARGAP